MTKTKKNRFLSKSKQRHLQDLPLFPFHPQVVTKPPEFERFNEFGESSLADSDNDYTEPMMYANTERKDIFVIEVGSLIEISFIIC